MLTVLILVANNSCEGQSEKCEQVSGPHDDKPVLDCL